MGRKKKSNTKMANNPNDGKSSPNGHEKQTNEFASPSSEFTSDENSFAEDYQSQRSSSFGTHKDIKEFINQKIAEFSKTKKPTEQQQETQPPEKSENESNENSNDVLKPYDSQRRDDLLQLFGMDKEVEPSFDKMKEMLQQRVSSANKVVNNARIAANDPSVRQALQDLNIPLGFEEVKDEEKGAYFEEIIGFFQPFMNELVGKQMPSTVDREFEVVKQMLRDHFVKYADKKAALMKLMNVNQFIVPTISLDLPAEIILAYNKMEDDDPLVAVFRLHPLIGEEVYKFGIFLDHYDTNKEAVFSLVWSAVDHMVICLPQIGLNPYPTCWQCEKGFGIFTCAQCGVAKYCSKECQVKSWKKAHKRTCAEIQTFAKRHQYMVFT